MVTNWSMCEESLRWHAWMLIYDHAIGSQIRWQVWEQAGNQILWISLMKTN